MPGSFLLRVGEDRAHLHELPVALADQGLLHLLELAAEPSDLCMVRAVLVVVLGVLQLSLLRGVIVQESVRLPIAHYE